MLLTGLLEDAPFKIACFSVAGVERFLLRGRFALVVLGSGLVFVGIGILGVIGITIVGIQYLTAGGSEEKTRKAKRRMLEIIIGLVTYVVIFALLQWLGVGG